MRPALTHGVVHPDSNADVLTLRTPERDCI